MNYVRAFIPNSYVFITFVTYKRKEILIQNIDLLKQAFSFSKTKYNYEIFAIVVLPDHIHLIIKPVNIKDYPEIIRCVKSYFSRNVELYYSENEILQSRKQKCEKNIWQRRYWEHTILSEEDLYKHLDYIFYNPVKHGYVNAVKDWKYSSFIKFVKKGYYDINWGNIEPQRIKNLNIE